MTLTEIIEIMAKIKLLWSERDSMGYVIDFQDNYDTLKKKLAEECGITVHESLNNVEFGKGFTIIEPKGI